MPPDEQDRTDDWGELIFAYTRTKAIADGVLVNVSDRAKRFDIGYPVAFTSAVHAAITVGATTDTDQELRVDLVLLTLRRAASQAQNTDRLFFSVKLPSLPPLSLWCSVRARRHSRSDPHRDALSRRLTCSGLLVQVAPTFHSQPTKRKLSMNAAQHLQTTEISLKKLLAWNGNVRRTNPDQHIEELAASIAAVGLLQNLVVRQESRGKFTVVAGRRRLLALSQLAAAGAVKSTMPVPCRLLDPEAGLTEISLTENVVRESMNPADEVEAFQRLMDEGMCVAGISARFGVTEAVVEKRLALARISPVLIQVYRDGQMNLEVLQAFALTDDHTQQETVWSSLPTWNRTALAVRQWLSKDDIPATDKRVRFVGLAQYEREGGPVRRDLFAEHEQGVSLTDPATLNRLVAEKLDHLADHVKAEGWKWVEVQPALNYTALGKFTRIPAERSVLSPKDEAKLSKLNEKLATLESQLESVRNPGVKPNRE